MSETITSRPSVTIHLGADDYSNIGGLMAPLNFDESEGESVWACSTPGGGHKWIAASDGCVVVVTGTESSVETDHFECGEPWAFPINEAILMAVGGMRIVTEGASITLSDDRVVLHNDNHRISLPQYSNISQPPLEPEIHPTVSFLCDPAALTFMLNSAKMMPVGVGQACSTPMRMSIDPVKEHIDIVVDWTPFGGGRHEYQFPVNVLECASPRLEWVVPFSKILMFTRDPFSSQRFGVFEVSLNPTMSGHMKFSGNGSAFYVPTIPDHQFWGPDLDESLGELAWYWVDSSRVRVFAPSTGNRPIDLITLADDGRHGSFRFRTIYEVVENVLPTPKLYEEVNSFNGTASGCRLVVDGTRVIALADFTSDVHGELGKHLNVFAERVSGIEPLMNALLLER